MESRRFNDTSLLRHVASSILYADFALVIAQAPGVEILFSSQIQNGSQIKCFEVFEPFFPPSAFALNLRGQLLLGLAKS
jgi:hypothetical protein